MFLMRDQNDCDGHFRGMARGRTVSVLQTGLDSLKITHGRACLKGQPIYKSARKQDLEKKLRTLHSNVTNFVQKFTMEQVPAQANLYSEAIIIPKPKCMLLSAIRIHITNHSAAVR